MYLAQNVSANSTANSRRLRLSFELLSAFYSSVLLAFVAGTKPFYASSLRRYLYLWHPHAVSLRESDFILFFAEFFLIPAVVVFLCLRLMRRFSMTRILLRLGGAIAIAGFPLACMYSIGYPFFAVLELTIATVCFLLWAYRKWPLSATLNALLMIVNYAFWFLFSGVIARVPPSTGVWDWWSVWTYIGFLCPLVGIVYSLVWAVYFRRMDMVRSPAKLEHCA